MKTKEIKETCINSCKIYYQYLADNNKGRSIIRINRISKIPNTKDLFKLELLGKIFDTDAITFYHTILDKEFDTTIIKIKEYDYDNNVIIIKQSQEIPFDFEIVKTEQIQIISDLKYLVERVRVFFENNGERLKVPDRINGKNITIKDFIFLTNHTPNIDQQNALLNIFHNPFSYIWGAPGTGKTKFVLAYSVIKYVEIKKKVAIFAPTNIALEQVLRGVIEITDQAGIKRENILRIGNPSKKFAQDFPQVCEVAGLQKKIKELTSQIRILENILGMDNLTIDEKGVDNLIEMNKKYSQSLVKSAELKKEINNLNTEIIELNDKLYKMNNDITIKEKTIMKKERQRSSYVYNLFSNSKKLNNKIQSLNTELDEFYLQKNSIKNNTEQKESRLTEAKNKLEECDLLTRNTYKRIKLISFKDERLNSAIENLDSTNLIENQNELIRVWNKIVDENPINESLKSNYKGKSANELKLMLEANYDSLDKLKSADTEERLKNVNIIGATLDGYIGRFPDGDLHVDHYFIDEAGYANIVKSLSVFIYGKPITLLGDHMQLPPVFEMNERDIEYQRNPELFIWNKSSIFTEFVFKYEMDYCKSIKKFEPVISKQSNLKITHRFGQNLADILDHHIYNIGFTSNGNNEHTKISFIHADKCDPQRKRDNLNEIEAIEKLIQRNPFKDFSIIAPYSDQIHFLRRVFPELIKEERLLTVHKSQGREWDTVILSVCDTSNKWFTDSQHPTSNGRNVLNTAVSRAIKDLIIVCDYNYWRNQTGQLIQGLLTVANRIEN